MMRYFILGACLAAFALPAFADDVYVDGYYRDDGTYVQGHFRSEPNSFKFDNYSAEGNINPYTGEPGTKSHEFSTPDYGSDYGSGLDNSYGNDLYD